MHRSEEKGQVLPLINKNWLHISKRLRQSVSSSPQSSLTVRLPMSLRSLGRGSEVPLTLSERQLWFHLIKPNDYKDTAPKSHSSEATLRILLMFLESHSSSYLKSHSTQGMSLETGKRGKKFIKNKE